ncbi:dTDP-4-dehydrorhamnose reductase [Marinobacter segnicrescens]|uniref:dTDP-4-dehydrorhamnose reductase n=1 Tax=Marinobacter segnicrescens TaxID=430453 RepID=A0A1I0EWH5_9GAMM|nr:dTDP-4-dehydrorhamnose reductase [Marinobacter segnicrescens]SET49735.1 dTDP-4-dehydrorhamnose reductase [Marinobacter segnicrescens]
MSILLFGANGQVGTELRRTLLPHGDLTALTRMEADLSDANAVKAAIASAKPKVIVNAAAYTAVDRAESEPELASSINRDAVAAMAEAASVSGALLVHYSTDYVFAGGGSQPYQTDDPTGPKGVYGKTKLEGEMAIAASGCDHLIFRTSWVYASHGHNFVKTMLRLGQEKDQLRVVADQVGAPTSAELIADVTALAINAATQGRINHGVYHLTAGGETSWHGLATYVFEVARECGLQLTVAPDKIEAIPTSEFPTPASRPANSRLSNASLEAALGIHMPDWRLHARRAVEQLLMNERK